MPLRSSALRILVVEDDPGIADVLEFALTAAGHSVRLESTGAAALESLPGVDFVVLDIGLPDVDGFDVCREIRKSSDVPILMLTSRADEIDRVVGLELGADDYLTKPFSTRELVARVKAINRRRNPKPDTSGLHLNRDAFTAEADGTPLDLSRTEFELLALLAGQPGRVFTRGQILDHAWSDGGFVTDRTVDAHVKSLRRKLPDADLIETVRGVGYRLRSS
ncbi:MAG: winged helix-turn-helix domain-containing protein [Terrimicrobiaceae bacterium]|nr:winged helix-turn-helix domain-containing protein [Terrimicrobiaceae bacterium]